MICQYCQARNNPDDHRCGRCGRRHLESARPVEMPPVQHGSAAAELALPPSVEVRPQQSGPRLVTEPPRQPGQSNRPAYQASLFGPQEALPPALEPPRRSGPRRPKTGIGAVQQALAFDPEPSRQELRYRETAVAIAAHRVMAAAVDLSLGIVFSALFFATLHFGGISFEWTKATLPVYAACALIICLFYRVLFCLGNCDTPGLQSCGLRLVSIDGRALTRKQRFARMAGGLVSAIAAGLGLLWALVDEDRFTWHDYISRSYPTPR